MEHMNFDGTDITNFLCQTLFLLLWHFLMFDINSFCYSPYIWFVCFSFHFPDGPFLGDQCCEAGQCIGHADQRRGVLWTGQVLLLYVAHLDVWGVNRENICPTLKTHLFYTKLNFYQELNCSNLTYVSLIFSPSIITFQASMLNWMTLNVLEFSNFQFKMHIMLWLLVFLPIFVFTVLISVHFSLLCDNFCPVLYLLW